MEIIDTSCQRKFGHVHDSEDSYNFNRLGEILFLGFFNVINLRLSLSDFEVGFFDKGFQGFLEQSSQRSCGSTHLQTARHKCLCPAGHKKTC